jgi:hypothetical protein
VALRGGDFITNAFGEAATVSFCFSNNDKKYRLTVAHLFEGSAMSSTRLAATHLVQMENIKSLRLDT